MSIVKEWFIRIYEHDGTTYTCGVFCERRGGGIFKVEDFNTDEVDCPGCLEVVETYSGVPGHF